MFINSPAFDWLTLTTWNQRIYEAMQNIAEFYAIAPGEDAKRMQYRGVQWGGVFVGDGVQNGRQHYMMQVSGMDTHVTYPDTLELPVKCTRLDAQVTVKCPKDWKAIEVANALRAYPNDAWGKGGKRKIVVYDDDGWDTIYIGAPSSDRRIRLYVKPNEAGEPYLRFEVQYNRKLADELHTEVRAEHGEVEEYLGGVLLDEIEAVPGLYGILPEPMLKACRMGRPGTRPKHLRTPSQGRTFNWLKRQVEPAVLRAITDHDEGPAIRNMIRSWVGECDMIDEVMGYLDTYYPNDYAGISEAATSISQED